MDNKNNNLNNNGHQIIIGEKIIEISSYNPSNSDNVKDESFKNGNKR